MDSLSHHDITILLISLAILLGIARGLGELAQRFQQPAVLGEIFAGILLGPTILGALFPSFQAAIFPSTGPVAISLNAFTTVAITLFLMVAGMEVDISTVWRQGKAAFVVGVVGMVVPFAIGFAPAYYFPLTLGADPSSNTMVFALFLATAMSITALPVIAKILLDLNLFRSELGVTIVAAAIFNDLVGWIIFALVLALMGTAATDTPVWQTCVFTLLFAFLMLTVGRWLVNRSLPWIQAHTTWPAGVMVFAMTLTLLSAAFTEFIGIHAIFGAFLFGIAFGDSTHLRQRTRTTIDHFVSFIFAPLFFGSIGLRVDFLNNFDLLLVLIVLAIATLGKVLGCTLAARWVGFNPRESRAIGFGMNARGAMEIILGLLARDAGIIGDKLFVALVVMALVTSMSSGYALQQIFRREKVVKFIDYAKSSTFFSEFKPKNRVEAITLLARAAAKEAEVDADRAVRAVLQRDRLINSATGSGVAVPHARIAEVSEPVVAIGVLNTEIDFNATDGVPVSLVILILMPLDTTELNLALLRDVGERFQDETKAKDLARTTKSILELRAALNVEDAERAH